MNPINDPNFRPRVMPGFKAGSTGAPYKVGERPPPPLSGPMKTPKPGVPDPVNRFDLTGATTRDVQFANFDQMLGQQWTNRVAEEQERNRQQARQADTEANMILRGYEKRPDGSWGRRGDNTPINFPGQVSGSAGAAAAAAARKALKPPDIASRLRAKRTQTLQDLRAYQ